MVFITGQFLHSSNIFSYADEMHPFEQDKTFHNLGRKIFSALVWVQKPFNYKIYINIFKHTKNYLIINTKSLPQVLIKQAEHSSKSLMIL